MKLDGNRKSINSLKTNWTAVAIYYFLACLWSWPFFWWRDMHPESWKSLEIPSAVKNWLVMWGPGISAIICFFLFKSHIRKITFRGTGLVYGVLTVCLFPIVLALLNQNPEFLFLGVIGFISILGEELGWRGFLQDALKLNSDIKNAVLIGISWEIWHFTNRIANRTLISSLIMVSMWMIIMILFSYLMIKLTKKTQSLFIPIAAHMALNAAFQFEYGWQSVLICFPFWTFIYWKWIQKNRTIILEAE